MNSKIAIAVIVAMLCGAQSNAQSFLEHLGQSIKKEIKKEVQNKVGKEINNLKDALKDKKQETKQVAGQEPKQEQKQSSSKPVVNPTDVPITKMETWKLVIKDGKPHYGFIGGVSEQSAQYYLDSIEYEHPDGVEPYTFTSAVATFKAFDGYYFDKALKLNEGTKQAENTVGFKRVDSKTVKVYLKAFTGAMGYDVRITPEMIEYKNKIKDILIVPVATAQINAPIFDYWSKRVRYGDSVVSGFIENNMRAYYQYPTTEERKTTKVLS